MVLSKGIGGGLPVAGIVGTEAVMTAWAGGMQSSTYEGNPVACAAGAASIDFSVRHHLLDNVARIGTQISDFTESWVEFRSVGDVRGRGAMWGVEIVKASTIEPDPDEARRLQRAALAAGVIVYRGGYSGNVLSILPPLVATAKKWLWASIVCCLSCLRSVRNRWRSEQSVRRERPVLKIRSIEASVHRFPVFVPLLEDPVENRAVVVCRVETDDGCVGYGLTGHFLPSAVVAAVHDSFLPKLKGMDVRDVEAIHEKVWKELNPRAMTGVVSSALVCGHCALGYSGQGRWPHNRTTSWWIP